MRVAPFLRRHVIFRAHELLTRRDTLSDARELEETQWLAPAGLRALQEKKLSLLIRHAVRNVPHYRQCLADADRRVNRSEAFDALSQFPLQSKDDIRRAGDSLLWKAAPGKVTKSCTGGSTGEPLVFCTDRRRQAYDQAARMRSHRWFGVELGDCEVLLWGSPIEQRRTDRVRSLRDRFLNQHLLDAFRMSPERMDAYVDVWNRLQPAALFGYPSSIALFIRHVRTRGRVLNTRRLRTVFVTGEVCYPHDRREIEDGFQVPVADGYGSREAGFIAHQCPQGCMHVTAENVIVEIIRDGRTVPIGETGEIVITHLDAYAMPFIRYCTGDFGRLLPGRCRCGRGLPLMDVVEGRSTDFLTLPDGTIKHALSIIYPLRELEGVRRFRVTQQADFGVTVEVVAEKSMTAEAIASRVRPVLGETVPLGVRLVDAIETTASGKFRYVVSHARQRGEPAPQ
jgi:phenylacetate-CoA ligase